MTTLARIVAETSSSPAEFASAYLRYVGELLARLDANAVAGLIERLEAARAEGRTVFLIGNGGSAATASHMANDLGMCADESCGGALRVMALTDCVPIMTAIANDFGYERMFARQLEIHYRPGDVLVAISASGNSPNLLAAAEWVKARSGTVIGLLGFDGGKLRELCDWVVIAETPKGEYGPVEDAHMVLDHLLTTWLARHRWR
jgi:D-sedoheptulose 7-phosphate isomerase